jgi:predicted permease
VALLSYQDWKTRFGGDPEVVGRRLQYFEGSDGTEPGTLTVVGVLPEGFNLGPEPTLWRPYSSEGGMGRSRLFVNVGRLRPGVARSTAAAEFRTVGALLARENPEEYERWRFEVRPFRDLLGRYQGAGRSTFFGVTVLVLLVAILNVSGLVLARTSSRRGELSVRSALGASRMRLVRQHLVEGITLGLVGGVCAALLTAVGMYAVRPWFRMQQADLPPQIDYRVLAFLLGLSVLAGILTALLPALRSGDADLGGALRDRPGSALGGRAGRSTRILLTAQMAAALVLVSGAALLGSDFLKVRYLDVGFVPKGLQRAYLSAVSDFGGSPEVWRPVAEGARDRVARTPGVEGAALERSLGGEVRTDRDDDPSAGPRPYTEIYAVDPTYFAILGTPLLAGRGFASSDNAAAPPAAIVNAAAATSFWPGESALGHQILVGDSTGGTWLTVVGVTEDVEMVTGHVERHTPVVYRPFAQVPLSRPRVTLYVRLERGHPSALAAAQASAREALGRPVTWSSVEGTFSSILEKQRRDAIAVNLFAAFALLLAAMGVYGSVTYFVSSRTREIGIRMALGARARSVLALVGRQSVFLTVGGVALGLGGALMLTRVLGAFAWRTGGELNPWLLAGAAGLMVLVVAVATYLPARRAVRIEPAVALRTE